MLSSSFGGLTKPTLSTFSYSSPKPHQLYSPAPSRPSPGRRPPLFRLRPAPHPPSWHLLLLPGSSADPRVRPTATVRDLEYPDAVDCGCGEFELIYCRDHGCGRRLGGFGSPATERRPSLHCGRTGLRLPDFPLVTGSIQLSLLVTLASEGGMARRESSAIGQPLR